MELFDIMMFVYVRCLFIGAPLVGVIIAIIQARRQKRNPSIEEEPIEVPVCQPQSEFLDVKVVGKRIHTEFNGVRQVKSTFWFLITFETTNGDRREFSVSQEYFEKIEEGQEGTLVIVNGNFFDFGEGEEFEVE